MALVYPVIFGGAAPISGDYLVRFIDFDGTILKEQWVNAGQAATAPTPPTHQYLTFDEWNNAFTNIQHDLDVGATYCTTDGKTYLFMRFTNTTGLQPAIRLIKADTSLMTITWGDGTSQTTSASGNIAITKTDPYTAIGDYTITIECVGDWSLSTYIFNNDAAYNSCLLRCYLGTHVIHFAASLRNLVALENVMVPQSITNIYGYAFASCYSLKSIVIPKGSTSIGLQSFYSCYSLESIIIPDGTQSIGRSAFQNCESIKSVIIPNSTVTIDAYVFFYSSNLKLIKASDVILNIPTYAYRDAHSLKKIIHNYAIITIHDHAFTNCYALKTNIILATSPPSLSNTNAFTNITSACKIYVPDASVSVYQGATNWITYANYFYPISELSEYAGTIFFQCNGGNAIKQIQGEVGTVATEPTAPTKAGVTFAGWYKEAALTTAWNWASDVSPATNITLYAKWV